MKLRKMILCAAPFLLVAGIAYGNLSGGNEPAYVLDAMSAVSNKMSYSYGISRCKAMQGTEGEWGLSCSSANTPTALTFSVLSLQKALSNVATPFYLIATNVAAKESSNEELMSLLQISNDAGTGEAKQLAAN